MKEYLPWILAGVLAILLFADRCGGGRGGASPQKDTLRIETSIRTFRDSIIIHHWHPWKETFIRDTVRIMTDEEVRQDYFMLREFDSSHTDSAGTWRARAMVWQNQMQGFRLDLDRTITTHNITLSEPASTHIWLGAFMGGGQGFDYGPQGIFMDRKGRAYTVNYSLTDKTVRFGLGLKLK